MAQMTPDPTVDVFLGHPLVDVTEQQFLARLRRDLSDRAIPSLILANTQLGKRYQQVDFVIVSSGRVAVVELKGWRDALVGGANGRWKRRLGARLIDAGANPYRQAHECGYALGDEMLNFVRVSSAKGPSHGGFIAEIDVFVCIYPEINAGSKLERHQWVDAVGYDELVRRLESPGSRPRWSRQDWDDFVRHMGLYRDSDDSEPGRRRRQGIAVVDEYCERFAMAHSEPAELVATAVRRHGEIMERPNLVDELLAGRDYLLWGDSGQGKTVWASAVAGALARAGHVALWLPARSFADNFSTFAARAVAPYSTVTPDDLIASARAAGRHVVFLVDGLNELAPGAVTELIAGVQGMRIYAPSDAALFTAQRPEVPGIPEHHSVELVAPTADERREIVLAHGGDRSIATIEGLHTPLELAAAARCAKALDESATSFELLDAYIDETVGGEPPRAVLRSIAWRMHDELRLSIRAPDAVRGARRDLRATPEVIRDAVSSRLVRQEHGRIAFSHERFAHLLAAEALLDRSADGAGAAALLNRPRFGSLTEDVIALEHDEARLSLMLRGLEDASVLVKTLARELGRRPARATHALLCDALRTACERTRSNAVGYTPSDVNPLLDQWDVPWIFSQAERTQLLAVGRCLARGFLADEVAELIRATEEMSRKLEEQSGQRRGWTLPSLFSRGRPAGKELFPVSVVMSGIQDAWPAAQDPHATCAAARQLLSGASEDAYGTLYFAMQLLRFSVVADGDLVVQLVERCVRAPWNHLRLDAFDLVRRRAHGLSRDKHARVLAAVSSFRTTSVFLASSHIDALAALRALEPVEDLERVLERLRETLSKPDDPDHQRMAAAAISSQFEEEDVVGPWSEAIESLSDGERAVLFAMALDGGPVDGLGTNWVLEQPLDSAEPCLRDAVARVVRRLDPKEWSGYQHAVASAVLAVEWLANAGQEIPSVGSRDDQSAWNAHLDLVGSLARDDQEAIERAVDSLLAQHSDSIADFLCAVHWAGVVMYPDGQRVERAIVAAFGAQLTEVLTRSIDQPRRRSLLGRLPTADERLRYTVEVLGQIGDSRAAERLRRLADDPIVGDSAVAAVRAIEARR